jgi:adenosylcobinamide-phosphate synthase
MIALLVDALAGEPPARLHPTVRMGQWISRGRGRRISRGPLGSFGEGALLLGGGVAISAGIAALVDRGARAFPDPFATVARGVALKPALSLRPLLSAGRQVRSALDAGQLGDARRLLAWHLVSRDTSTLSAAEVAGAAIESIAENLNDSVIAPLLAFRWGGLAAAYAHRMINTADAMLGYRTHELEWFGKASARVDDAVAFVPARVAAALICGLAPVGGGSCRRAMAVALRDAHRTASPNAGWPMAAMAGALGVRLTKRGHYRLNATARVATPADIGRCCRIVAAAAVAAAALTDLV